MTVVWKEFERRWRALYKQELRSSPELRAEVKRQRKSDSRNLPRLTRRIILPLFWCGIFVSVAGKQTRLDLPGAALALWAAGAAFRWGHHWFQQFYASEDLVVLNLLPLDDARIFKFQLRRYLGAAGWLFWEMSLAYLVLAFVEGALAPPLYQLLLAGILQAILVVALAIHLASWVHMLPLGTLGGLLRLTAVALLILGSRESELTRYFTQATEWFLPNGWVNYVLFRGPTDPAIYALLVPIAALIYLSRYSFHRLRTFYSLAGVEIVPAPSAAPRDEELTGENAGRRPGPTEIEDRILGRRFLEGLNWELSGFIEKLAARILTPDERVITEFLVAGNPGWTNTLRLSFWIWLLTCIVVLTLGQFGGMIIFFAAYVLATTSLPLFGGEWRGMRQTASGGVYLPAYSVYPISFNSIARILMKVNLLRIACASPLLVSFATLAAFRLDQSPLTGALIGAKLVLVLACLQPLLVLFPISNTTNDASRGRVFIRLLFLAPILLVLIAAILVVFTSHSPTAVMVSYATLVLFSILVLVAYRRSYRRGRFDLLTHRSPN